MKINSMKLVIIMALIIFLAATMTGLFFKSIPTGNGDVLYMFVGLILGILANAISTMFKKE